MTTNGVDFLNMLASGIRPVGAGAPRPTQQTSGADFSSMLSQAQRGELRTGLDVAIAPALDLTLSAEQNAALSAAADKAESGGAAQSLVLMDDMALVLDVTARQIVDIADLSQAGVLTGIDSVIRASAGDRADASPQTDRNTQVSGASLLDALARIDHRRTHAA